MPYHDILVIGASAGGVHALTHIASELPQDLPASVFVVQHVAPYGKSAMPGILSRSGPLPAIHPEDGARIEPGRIYVAPPDHHLVIEPGRVRLSRGPTENGHRPAVDVLFRTAARSYGPRVVGVVLTGNLDDGTAGLAEIKKHHGVSVVQDPSTADYVGMPTSAKENVDVDHLVPLGSIASVLAQLSREQVTDNPGHWRHTPKEGGMKEKLERGEDRNDGEKPSGLTCPECGGALWESQEHEIAHFRCRTGHAFAPESLLAEQLESLDYTLWAAVRALEENAALARRMERWMTQRGSEPGRLRYDKRAREAERHAEILRELLVEAEPATTVAE